MNAKQYRTEKDSMGEVEVPENAKYAAQTQRAIDNFQISGIAMPKEFISALGLIKSAAATVNAELGLLTQNQADAINKASMLIAEGQFYNHFPVDVFQTGSGTSSNMNANEVIANIASEFSNDQIHPNDHINMGQSSNDVIPTAIHLSSSIAIHRNLLPSLEHLKKTIETKADKLKTITKTGRTHLMDAMPITLEQELSGWANQISHAIDRINNSLIRLQELAQGGTAVGTGINAHPEFAIKFAKQISKITNIDFSSATNKFESLSSQDAVVEMSGSLKTLAVSIMKISNDLRWMNSGPLAGLGEIALPALQPGSSIMPGKVNPVIPESVAMVCAQVMGNDTTITIAGSSGNFQLNVMLPIIAYNILQSISILSNAATSLANNAIINFTVNEDHIKKQLDCNPILVTALNSVIGYEKGAQIAKAAYAEGRPVIDVAAEMTDLAVEELNKLLNPFLLTNTQ